MEAPKQDFSQTIDRVDSDETLLAVIKRHPFGIIKIYVQAVVGLVGAMALIGLVLPDLLQLESNSGLYFGMGIGTLVVAGVMLVILMIATVIYYQTKIVVTTKSITQTLQISLFSKKTSQLAVTSIEDVTSNKNGLFPTLLNYGQLKIETAGEQENFHFDYCPHPDHYAKLILDTRQQYMGNRDEIALRHTNRMNNYSDSSNDANPNTSPNNTNNLNKLPPSAPPQTTNNTPPSTNS